MSKNTLKAKNCVNIALFIWLLASSLLISLSSCNELRSRVEIETVHGSAIIENNKCTSMSVGCELRNRGEIRAWVSRWEISVGDAFHINNTDYQRRDFIVQSGVILPGDFRSFAIYARSDFYCFGLEDENKVEVEILIEDETERSYWISGSGRFSSIVHLQKK